MNNLTKSQKERDLIALDERGKVLQKNGLKTWGAYNAEMRKASQDYANSQKRKIEEEKRKTYQESAEAAADRLWYELNMRKSYAVS